MAKKKNVERTFSTLKKADVDACPYSFVAIQVYLPVSDTCGNHFILPIKTRYSNQY